MSDSAKHTIFTETDCISEQTMFDYIDKKLSAKECHIVEKHLLHCELCTDALEGLELVKDRGRIARINQAVQERIAAPVEEKKNKIIPFSYKVILSIAAALLLLIGSAYIFTLFKDIIFEAYFNFGFSINNNPMFIVFGTFRYGLHW